MSSAIAADLRLRRWPALQPQGRRPRRTRRPARQAGRSRRSGAGPLCLTIAFERFPGEVESVESRIAPLQPSDDAKRLDVVVEAAKRRHARLQLLFAGMGERRMAKVVAKGDGLGEVGVETKRRRQGTGDLRDLERMGESGAEMVAGVGDEHLGLAFQPAEGGAVDDPVAVAGEGGAGGARRLPVQPAAAPRRILAPRRPGIVRGRPPWSAGPLRRARASAHIDVMRPARMTDASDHSLARGRRAAARARGRGRRAADAASRGRGRRLLWLPVPFRPRARQPRPTTPGSSATARRPWWTWCRWPC